jgi:hypothetical protein
VDAEVVEHFVTTLRGDLASGAWDKKYGEFRRLAQFDGGLRLVVGQP